MSSRKNVLLPKHVLVNGDMTGNLESDVIDAKFQDNIGLQVEWTGTPSGTIKVEASVNHNLSVENQGTFYALTFDPVLAQPAGGAGGYLINLNQLPFAFYKVTYEATGGTGTLNVYACSKEV